MRSAAVSSLAVAAFAVHTFRPDTLYAWIKGQGVFRTEDGGAGWLYAATPAGAGIGPAKASLAAAFRRSRSTLVSRSGCTPPRRARSTSARTARSPGGPCRERAAVPGSSEARAGALAGLAAVDFVTKNNYPPRGEA